MHITSKGQVTIPKEVRSKMGITQHTNIEFVEEKNGRFYVKKTTEHTKKMSRFRTANKVGQLIMGTDEIMKLTRT